MSSAPPPLPPPPFGGDGRPIGAPSPYGTLYDPRRYREHPDGTTVLVLGILGVMVCGILGPIAWAKGNRVRREMDAQPTEMWTNRGTVTAGWVCGIVATVIMIVQVVFLLGFLILVIAVEGG